MKMICSVLSLLVMLSVMVTAEKFKIVDSSPLVKAVKAGDIALVKRVLDKDLFTIDDVDKTFDVPAVHMAVMMGDVDILTMLLEAGADPNYSSLQAMGSSLSLALQSSRPTMVKALLDHGADPNFKLDVENFPHWFYGITSGPYYLEQVLEHGANISAQEKALGITALQMASSSDWASSAVEMLLEAGADPNVKNGEGKPSMEYFLKAKNYEAATLLLEAGFNVDDPIDTQGTTMAMELASDKSNYDFLKQLVWNYCPDLSLRAGDDRTALHFAVDDEVKSFIRENTPQSCGQRFGSSQGPAVPANERVCFNCDQYKCVSGCKMVKLAEEEREAGVCPETCAAETPNEPPYCGPQECYEEYCTLPKKERKTIIRKFRKNCLS